MNYVFYYIFIYITCFSQSIMSQYDYMYQQYYQLAAPSAYYSAPLCGGGSNCGDEATTRRPSRHRHRHRHSLRNHKFSDKTRRDSGDEDSSDETEESKETKESKESKESQECKCSCKECNNPKPCCAKECERCNLVSGSSDLVVVPYMYPYFLNNLPMYEKATPKTTTSNAKEPTKSYKEPTTKTQEPTTSTQKSTTNTQKPTSTSKETTTTSKEPTTTSKESTTTSQEATTTSQEPTTTSQEPTTTEISEKSTKNDEKNIKQILYISQKPQTASDTEIEEEEEIETKNIMRIPPKNKMKTKHRTMKTSNTELSTIPLEILTEPTLAFDPAQLKISYVDDSNDDKELYPSRKSIPGKKHQKYILTSMKKIRDNNILPKYGVIPIPDKLVDRLLSKIKSMKVSHQSRGAPPRPSFLYRPNEFLS